MSVVTGPQYLRNSAPVANVDVPNGTDIHDVAHVVMKMIEHHSAIPKHIREQFLDADGNTVAEIAVPARAWWGLEAPEKRWEGLLIGQRVRVRKGQTFPSRGHRIGLPVRDELGRLASSGGPAGHSVLLDDGRVVAVHHDALDVIPCRI